MRDDRSIALEPMVAHVSCEGSRHRIEWRSGRLRALDHDEESEHILATLGARLPYCASVLSAWRQPPIDLVAMLGRDDDHNPRREGLSRRGRSVLWELPVRLRHRLVLARVLQMDVDDDIVELLVALESGRVRLDRAAFRRLSAALTSRPPADSEAAVLARFFDGTRLTEIPAKGAKRRVVLERLAREFEPGRDYPEREVKRKLGAFHPDQAALRRYLVDEGLLERSSGVYRRAE